ncbi:carbohydrate binding domain-containing protein [Kitasatospora saccharophila]|uniref:carbohydrate binding domain-containing protein n=1 Tax=Kitasatospora saccharophila TaxID=407973 RepID=UPI00362B43E2
MERAEHAPRVSHARTRQSAGRRTLAGVSAAAVIGAGLAVAGTVTASADVANLIANPGFESGLANWTCTSGSGATVVTTPVHGGTSALKATPGGQDTAQCSQTISVQPNSQYTLSGFVQGNYVYLGATGTGVNASTWAPGNASYGQLSTTFSTGASTTSVTVFVHGWYGQPAFYADDLVLSGPGGSGSPSPSTSAPTSQPPTSQPPTSQPPRRSRRPPSPHVAAADLAAADQQPAR